MFVFGSVVVVLFEFVAIIVSVGGFRFLCDVDEFDYGI